MGGLRILRKKSESVAVWAPATRRLHFTFVGASLLLSMTALYGASDKASGGLGTNSIYHSQYERHGSSSASNQSFGAHSNTNLVPVSAPPVTADASSHPSGVSNMGQESASLGAVDVSTVNSASQPAAGQKSSNNTGLVISLLVVSMLSLGAIVWLVIRNRKMSQGINELTSKQETMNAEQASGKEGAGELAAIQKTQEILLQKIENLIDGLKPSPVSSQTESLGASEIPTTGSPGVFTVDQIRDVLRPLLQKDLHDIIHDELQPAGGGAHEPEKITPKAVFTYLDVQNTASKRSDAEMAESQDWSQRLTGYVKQVEGLQQKLTQKESELAERLQEKRAVEKQLQELQVGKKAFKTQYDVAVEESERRKQRLEFANNEITKLKAQIDKNESESARLASEHAKKVQELRGQVEQFDQEAGSLHDKLVASGKTIARLQEEQAAHNNQLKIETDNNAELQEKLTEAANMIASIDWLVKPDVYKVMVELKDVAPEAGFVRLIVGAYLNFHTSVAVAGKDPERIVKASRAQIERLDDIVFREGGNNIELLDRIREILGSHVNALLSSYLSVVWPTPGTVIDEDVHNALSHGGGRVKIAESAIVRDGNGKVLTRARVQVM